jgi:hypothetical protein
VPSTVTKLTLQFAGAVAFLASAAAQQLPISPEKQSGTGNSQPIGLFVPQDHRPGLFFKEDFKAPPTGVQETPVTQAYLQNSNLELKLYGPGGIYVQIDHHQGEPKDDPNFLWSGVTPGPWAVAFKEKNNYVDLSGLGKIRWRTEQTGYHALHPILKLADGTWLVGDYAEAWTPDWRESEFWPAWIRWRKLDINKVAESPTGTRYENGKWEADPDLSKVDESGFTDLMGGSGHGQGGWSRIDWIEVYGVAVKREASAKGSTTSAPTRSQ